MVDGLRIMRYNKSTAYTPVADYLQDDNSGHDFDSAELGSNRFVSIILYLSDVTGGGETVFTEAASMMHQDPYTIQKQQQILTDASENAWEHELLNQCFTRLALHPKKARAILFYSQHPNGTHDPNSRHGGCPVREGTKWAANLWIWNQARAGYPLAPVKRSARGLDRKESVQRDRLLTQAKGLQDASTRATFRNVDGPPDALLLYEKQLWDDFPRGKTITVNTFAGHVWNVRGKSSKFRRRWVIRHDAPEQEFILTNDHAIREHREHDNDYVSERMSG
eukprot:CAMPEP_0185760138 /NCGR_PEP_ID=MMETSP1174-20130828/18987_1 /TAXON_ID=35687 /ORGANISM="Dictyocha speculum, Strain CCMP1381" /LENGTH=278 /DNA_ID=CAMNT_0028440823 /DNA_START=807 /DNA_END=1643 /DNA_ORIENTATION=-